MKPLPMEEPPVGGEIVLLLERLFPNTLTVVTDSVSLERARGRRDVVDKLRDIHNRQKRQGAEQGIRALGIEITD